MSYLLDACQIGQAHKKNLKTLKNLVQTLRYIKLSIKNQKQVPLVGMN